jgi:RNA polymerase-binding transcription factor DksA
VADEADLAGELIEMQLAGALDRRREMAAELVAGRREPHRDGGLACIECGDQIEPPRLAALPATGYCAECAAYFERERERKRRSGA